MLSLLWAIGAFSDSTYDEQFSDFEIRFDRHYTPNERDARKAIFIENMKFIEEFHERNPGSVSLGVGPFADKTSEEFESNGGLIDEEEAWGDLEDLGVDDTDDLPPEIDWVKKGALSPVKSQGGCGSCWAFAGGAALESHYFIVTGNMTELSQQQLIDCDAQQRNKSHKCNGGRLAEAFRFAKNNGICTAASYPYECRRGKRSDACKYWNSRMLRDSSADENSTCTTSCDTAIPRGVVAGYVKVRRKRVLHLMAALTWSPFPPSKNKIGRPWNPALGITLRRIIPWMIQKTAQHINMGSSVIL